MLVYDIKIAVSLLFSVPRGGGGGAAAPGAGGGRQNGHQNTRKGQGAGFVRNLASGAPSGAPGAGGAPDYVHYWEVGAPTGLAAPGARHPRYATG
jgi:hypothetical protein